MIRPFLPTDLIAVLFQERLLYNTAKTKGSIVREETRFFNLTTLLGQWLNPQGRRFIWVWAKGLRIRGLASARKRSSPYTWEVDRLLLDERDCECCISLLEKLSVAGGESGVEKVFLRLLTESPLVDAAREVGFTPYITESLYKWEREEGKLVSCKSTPSCSPRRKQQGDDYRLFELYKACIPAPVQRIAGMTFQEWQKAKEKSATEEWVFEKEGNLAGWLQVNARGDTGQFEVMASSEEELEQIFEYGLMSLEGCRHLFCLTPGFQGNLIRLLRDYGFIETERYCALIKELTVKAKEPRLVPAGA